MNFNNYPPIHLILQAGLLYFTIQTFYYHFPTLHYSSLTWATALDLFKIHPFSMCISFMLLYNESVYVFCRIYPFPKKKWIHYALNIAGFILSLIGFSAIVYKKILDGDPHFKSWHGFFGFITMLHSTIQWISGWSIISPKWEIFDKLLNTKKIRKWWHRASGCIVAVEIFIVFATSCYTSWFQKVSYWFDFYLNITIYLFVTLFAVYLVAPRLHQQVDYYLKVFNKWIHQNMETNIREKVIQMNGMEGKKEG